MWKPLLTYKRDSLPERVVHGAFSWVHGDEEIHFLGGTDPFFIRSLLKPIQSKAISKELSSLLNEEEKALALASHNSETCHLEVLKYLDTSRIKVPSSFPLLSQSERNFKNPLFHPCSGKHAAILKVCQSLGWPQETYNDENHPFHERVLKKLEKALGSKLTEKKIGKDSCTLPTVALSLKEMAQIFSYLVREKESDWIWETMIKKNYLIGGKNRLDTEIMELSKGRILAKEGADGLLGLAIEHPEYPKGLGIAIKIAHGRDPFSMRVIAWSMIKNLFNFEEASPFENEQKITVHRALLPKPKQREAL